MQIAFTVSEDERYKVLPSINIIFTRVSFFFLLLSFSSHTGSELRKWLSLFVHSLVYPITPSFLDGFQPNLVHPFSYVCSTSRTIFSLNKTLECVCVRLLHCRLISDITWTPDECFTKAYRYKIYMDVSFCTESLKKIVGSRFKKLSFKL